MLSSSSSSSSRRSFPSFVALLAMVVLLGVSAQDNATETVTTTMLDENSTDTTAVMEPLVDLDCVQGTKAINSDETITAAMIAAVTGVIDLQNPLTCSTGGDKLYCEYDFGSAKSNFETVCLAAKGNVVERTFDIACKYDGSPGGITYEFKDTPACVAPACNETSYYEGMETTATEFATQLNNVNGLKDCEPSVPSSGAAVVVGDRWFGSFFVAVVTTALWMVV